MPSKKQYDLVLDIGVDTNTEMPSEEAFQKGFQFHAKHIGTRDVPRPSSRVEIVAAMRRIRYECKVKSIRKTKVNINVSVNGIKVILCKTTKKKKQQLTGDDPSALLHKYPIFRIFYVSHDSQDLQIFSYIARDDALDTFQCSVFKAYKKSQAVQIVRTIGQAFDVCHKLSVQPAHTKDGHGSSDQSPEFKDLQPGRRCMSVVEKVEKPSVGLKGCESLPNGEKYTIQPGRQSATLLQAASARNENLDTPVVPPVLPASFLHGASVGSHGYKLLHEQLILQTHQTQILRAEVQLLRENLASEATLRQDLQGRTQDLLLQNRELVDHIDVLVSRLSELEVARGTMDTCGVQRLMRLPSVSSPLGSVSESVSGRSLRHSIAHSFSYLEPSDLVSGLPSSQTVPLSLSSGPFGAASPTARSVDQPGAVSFIGGDEGAARFQQLSRSRATANSKIDAVHTRELERPIIVPLSLQDATGNRLELGGYAAMPRLKPPPRIPRDHCHSQTSAEPVARRSLAAPSGGNSAKRYSWDCRASVVANGAANGDADGSGMSTLPKPKKPVLNCSDYTIGGAEKPSSMVILTTDGGVSPSTATTISVSSNGGIESQLETSYCDNDSDSSTAELKLSFSDDECFVDVPVSKTAKKS